MPYDLGYCGLLSSHLCCLYFLSTTGEFRFAMFLQRYIVLGSSTCAFSASFSGCEVCASRKCFPLSLATCFGAVLGLRQFFDCESMASEALLPGIVSYVVEESSSSDQKIEHSM